MYTYSGSDVNIQNIRIYIGIDMDASARHLMAVLDASAAAHDFSEVRHTATHCNTLQYTAIYCNTLQHGIRRQFFMRLT